MRSVLSISISEKKKKEIARRAKKAGKTVSAYVISVLDLEKKLISEDELLEIANEAREEYKVGKAKKLNNLRDLM